MEAAYVLTESIKKGDWEDYRLANPGLFLYWHSIELFLKGARWTRLPISLRQPPRPAGSAEYRLNPGTSLNSRLIEAELNG